MKRILLILALSLPIVVSAQTTAEQFATRYATLVKNVGVDGVGVETLLNKWEAAFPDDKEMFLAKFLFNYTKSQSTEIVRKTQSRFLGNDPVMSLKDSLGVPVNFFQETFYDDAMFGTGLKYLDKAIQADPGRLDLRFYRIAALIGYEKESPDMATSDLLSLVNYNFTHKPQWSYPDMEKVDPQTFDALVQEYCYTFFRISSPASYEAFRKVSEKMLDYESGNPLFMDNLGSYYLVYAKDNKKALKYYNAVLKKHPDDLTAISNCVVMARTSKDVKMEKKYLPMLIKYSPDENTVNASKIRLEYLEGKKK